MTLWRYILRGFLRAILAVFAVIALVIVLFTSVENLRRFGETGVGSGDVVRVTLLQAPEVLYQVFPLVLMLASLVTFLRFARTSELVVMRASGISALRLIAVPVVAALAARRRVRGGRSIPSSPPRSSAARRSSTTSTAAAPPLLLQGGRLAAPGRPERRAVGDPGRADQRRRHGPERGPMHRFDDRRGALLPHRGAAGAADPRRLDPAQRRRVAPRARRQLQPHHRLQRPARPADDADQRGDPRELRPARDRGLLGPRPLHRPDGGVGLLRPAAPSLPADRARQARALRRHGPDRRRLRAAPHPLRADRRDDPARRPRRLRPLLPQGLRRIRSVDAAKSP